MIILKKFLVYITLVFILTSFSAMAQTNNTIRTIQVTTTEDELNSLVANETCSLREAIILSNERGDRDDFGGCRITRTPSTINSIFSINIILPAGEFKLTRNGFSLIDQDVGNLNVYRPIVIRGAGPEQTIIDGKGIQDIELTGGIVSIEPIPHIPTTLPPLNCVGCSVHFKDLSLKNGHTKSLGQFARPQGSAIYSEIHAVDLENVAIEDSVHNIEAVFSKLGVSAKNISCINNKGGCISTNREILVKDSIFKNNGVALNVSSGEINNSLFTDNIQAIRATSSDLLVITDSTIVDNNPGEQTAIEVVDDNDNTTIRIINSIVAGNFSGTSQRNCTLFFPFASEGFNLIGTDCIGFNKQGDQKLRTRPKLDVLFRPELDSFALDKGKTGCSSIDGFGFIND